MTILLTMLATVALTVVVMNFMTGEKKIDKAISPLYAVTDPQFLRSMGSLLGPALSDGNRVTCFLNGDEIFKAMLDAIAGTRRTISFETYIYWSGQIGSRFVEALSERARAGVKVHILLDWAGSSSMDGALLDALVAAGARVEKYHEPRWYSLSRMNNRTHRKLLVLDGCVGFTGGVGVADQWLGNAQDAEHWRDSHYRLEGPAVAQMQAAFMDNWMKAVGTVLHGEEYFPELPKKGQALAQVFKSSPGEGSESVRLMYLLSIASARHSVRIAAAYFVPDDLSLATLVEASKRGVKIEVILPGKTTDTELTRKASSSRWGKLLEAGIAIFEYQPTMFHCKVMIVDDSWVSVGSTNFDSRSFRLNDEANLNVFESAFAQDQIRIFEDDKARSRQVSLQEWTQRPWTDKVLEHAAGLLRSQL
jgi:cardiolipin synthase